MKLIENVYIHTYLGVPLYYSSVCLSVCLSVCVHNCLPVCLFYSVETYFNFLNEKMVQRAFMKEKIKNY